MANVAQDPLNIPVNNGQQNQQQNPQYNPATYPAVDDPYHQHQLGFNDPLHDPNYQPTTPSQVPYAGPNDGPTPSNNNNNGGGGSGSGGSGGGGGGYSGGGYSAGSAAPTLQGQYNYHSNVEDVYHSVGDYYNQMREHNQSYNDLIDWNNMAVDAATQQQVEQLSNNLSSALAQYDMLKARYAQQAMASTDNEALRQRSFGNLGGTGENQITHARADYDQKIMELDLATVQAENEVKNLIAEANATGDITKAQYAMEILQTIIGNNIEFLQSELGMNASLAEATDTWYLNRDAQLMEKVQEKIASGIPVSAADFAVYGYTGAAAEQAARYVNTHIGYNQELARLSVLNANKALYSGGSSGSSSGSSGGGVQSIVSALLGAYGTGASDSQILSTLMVNYGLTEKEAMYILDVYRSSSGASSSTTPGVWGAQAGAALGSTGSGTSGAPSSGINLGGGSASTNNSANTANSNSSAAGGSSWWGALGSDNNIVPYI